MEKLEGGESRNKQAFRLHLGGLRRPGPSYSRRMLKSCLALSLPNLRRLRECLQVLGAGLLLALSAFAPASAQDTAALIAQESQAWVEKAVADARPNGAAPLRMVVQVGALDSRLSLAPCAQVEPYMPPGARLWGKTRIGLRCIDGASRWNVFLPVQVQAFGQTWVIRSDVPAGAALALDDAVMAEVDWAQEDQSVLADPELWVGQTATRGLRTGQVLRRGMVKPSQVFQAGSMVRIVAKGPGFSVTSGGQALSAGVVGEMARVRVDNGRVVSGLVLDMRTVQVNL